MTDTPPEQPTGSVPPVPPIPPVEPPVSAAPTAPAAPAAPPVAPPAQPYAQQQPYQQPGYAQQPPTEGLAIAALITGILFWPVGIVLGFIALSKIKKTGNGGRILAILGVVFGFLGLVVTIIAVVASILFAIATAATVGSIADSYDDSFGSYGEVQDSVAIGETGTTDDGMQFTVSAIECGIPSVGADDFNVEPVGQFCRVDLTVGNNTDEPQYFSSSNVAAFASDTEYAADSSATFYDENSASFAAELNPGESSVEAVYFDVPVDTTLTRLELSGSILGGVVEVTL